MTAFPELFSTSLWLSCKYRLVLLSLLRGLPAPPLLSAPGKAWRGLSLFIPEPVEGAPGSLSQGFLCFLFRAIHTDTLEHSFPARSPDCPLFGCITHQPLCPPAPRPHPRQARRTHWPSPQLALPTFFFYATSCRLPPSTPQTRRASLPPAARAPAGLPAVLQAFGFLLPISDARVRVAAS